MFEFLFFVFLKLLYAFKNLSKGVMYFSQISQQITSPTYCAINSADAPA